MENLKNIIAKIEADAKKDVVNAIWDRVDFINNMLDTAYSDGVCGNYGYALNKAGDAVAAYMELVALCKETAEQPLREHLRDALGSVNWEKFELPANMMAAIKKARNDVANPKKTQIIGMPYYKPFAPKGTFDEVGRLCNEITKELKADFDGDTPWNQKYNNWKSFDSMDDLEDYLK